MEGMDRRSALAADFRSAKSTHIPHRQPHSFSRNAEALCEVIFHPIGPRATPLLRGHHPRYSLQEPHRTARQACAMAFRNAQGQRGKYLTLELLSTRNPVEDMYTIVSKFQSAKIGVGCRVSDRRHLAGVVDADPRIGPALSPRRGAGNRPGGPPSRSHEARLGNPCLCDSVHA
jgi:hypothetical protein